MKIELREIQYRDSKHGTCAPDGIPAFHTQFRSTRNVGGTTILGKKWGSEASSTTGVSYTGLPDSGPRYHRRPKHGPTGCLNTKEPKNTGAPYTSRKPNYPKPFHLQADNCTKPSCTNHNIEADVLFERRGGAK